ncbi:MAG: Gfo/Idh/MocA family oxidoreductase [Chloroflexota bacterium]
MINRPIRVGLAGCGYWGSKHLRVLNEIPGCEVVALCEPSEANLKRVPKGLLPDWITDDFDEMIAGDIDAVLIAAPARLHYPLAKAALLADKHVLTEKPFATSSNEAMDLIDIAEARRLTLMVGHTYVYHPAVNFLRKYIAEGKMGPLHYIHMARLNFGLLQPDVDVLWDLAPHDISILMYLLDEEPMVAGARGTARINPRLAEVAHLDLEFLDGLLAHIYVSWLEPVKVRRLTIIGQKQALTYDDTAQGDMIRIFNKSIDLGEPNGENGFGPPTYNNGDIVIPFVADAEPLRLEDTHFLDCIRSGERPRSDGFEGLKVVHILESAAKSLYNGGSMEYLTPGLYLGSHPQGHTKLQRRAS